MDQAKSVMVTNISSWMGTDADAFREQWAHVYDDGSVAKRFRKSLLQYADSIEACASVYKEAQIELINLASMLL